MYARRSPNYLAEVQAVVRNYPELWAAARERPDGSRDDGFIRRLAWELHKIDPNIGLNGKRGSLVLSTDALAYINPTAPGGAEVIDVIVGSTHTPSWQDATTPPGTNPEVPEGVPGRYIEPSDPGGGVIVQPPPPPPPPADDSKLKELMAKVEHLTERIDEVEKNVGAAVERRMNKIKFVPRAGGKYALGSDSKIGVWAHSHTVRFDVEFED